MKGTSDFMGSWYQCTNASIVDRSGSFEDKQSLGRRICNILFLDPVKVDINYLWYYRGIFPWYWPMVFVDGFRGKIIK